MATCDAAALASMVTEIHNASFSDNKIAYVTTSCQNYVFTVAQIVVIVKEFSFSSDRLKALDLFQGSTVDPTNAAAIAAAYDSSSDKKEAVAKVASFPATTGGIIAPLRIEDDGHRSPAEIARFLGMLRSAHHSSDKVELARTECHQHPNPPFDHTQLHAILKEFPFSADAAQVLEFFTGPKIVYPMACADMLTILAIYPHSSDKIAVLSHLKNFIQDAQNKLSLVASFTFSSDKDQAEEILRDVRVQLRPPVPPASAIQAALARVGTCPSGYQWVQVTGGWRCAAGGHYVSDAQLQAAMGGAAPPPQQQQPPPQHNSGACQANNYQVVNPPPPQQQAYPPQQGGNPQQQGGFPPGGFPPGGFAGQQPGYPQQQAYHPQQGEHPQQQGGFPPSMQQQMAGMNSMMAGMMGAMGGMAGGQGGYPPS